MTCLPILLVVSAPSGAGKTTLCHRLLEEMPGLTYSVSSTTRPPREGEVDGVDYDFLTRAAFDALVKADAFLEYAVVHGHGYGTRKDRVINRLEDGESVLLDVDVQGAALIRRAIQKMPLEIQQAYVDVFIEPPSIDSLRQRLEQRGKDSPEVIDRRVQNAAAELRMAPTYMYRVVNDRLEDAYAEIRKIFLTHTSGK